MESLSVRVKNPFALRESLQVALEVSWADLPAEQVSDLKRFIGAVPAHVEATAVSVSPAERIGLKACAAYFRQSRTWYWLREDLSEALAELERELCGK